MSRGGEECTSSPGVSVVSSTSGPIILYPLKKLRRLRGAACTPSLVVPVVSSAYLQLYS